MVKQDKKVSGVARRKTANITRKRSGLHMFGTILLMCAWVLFSTVICQLLVGWIMMAFGGSEILSNPVWMSIYSALVYVLAALLIIVVPPIAIEKWKKQQSAQKLDIRRELGLIGLPTWTDIGLAPIALIVALILAALLVAAFGMIFPWFNTEEAQNIGFSLYLTGWERILAFFTLVIVAPIMEELIFRGWLYNKIREKTSLKFPQFLSIIISIFITSLLFGIVHFQWNVGVNVFALSIILCILREITGTTYAGILTHILKNGFAFYLLYILGVR